MEKEPKEDEFAERFNLREWLISLIPAVWGILGLYLFSSYYADRSHFLLHSIYCGILSVVITAGLIFLIKLVSQWEKDQLARIINKLKEIGAEADVKNFINRFGNEKKKEDVWKYRDYAFDRERLKDLRKFLNERGLNLRTDDWQETLSFLKYYIQEKEERLTRDSITSFSQKKFSDLSGASFENLLKHLFEAMGYAVQGTGKSGDQGADLILNKGQERIIVQAKRNLDRTTGNGAIQEAAAAKKLYDCNKVMVVTTSEFSSAALKLAQANNVQLVTGKELSVLLLEHLKESWS